MKKIICIVLSAFLAISMAACSSSNDAKGNTSSQETGSSVIEESSDSEETPATLTELPEWVEKDSIEADAFYYSRDDVRMYFYEGCPLEKSNDENKKNCLYITGCDTIEEAQEILDQCIEYIKNNPAQ